jgi:hypothetical protein
MTPEERESILDKHKHIYNGYQTLQQNIPNPQPLYVQDFANDKEGITVSNTGKVMSYRNQNINESVKKGKMCECGGMMYEGECMECGKAYKNYDVDIYDVEDINPKNKFDYVEGKDLEESDWDIDSEFEVKKDFDLPKGHDHLKKGDKVKITKKWKNLVGDVFGTDKSMDDYGLYKDDIDYMSSDLEEVRVSDLDPEKSYKMKFPTFKDPENMDYEEKKVKYKGMVKYKDGKPMYQFAADDEDSGAMLGDDGDEISDVYFDEMNELESNYDYKAPAYQFKSNGPADAYDEDDKNYFEDSIDVFSDDDLDAGRAFSDKDDWTDEKILMSLRNQTAPKKKAMGTDTSIDMDLSDVKEPYDFASGGPGRSIGVYEEDMEEEPVEEMVDEDLKESFVKQKNKITEMFDRMKKY